MNAEWTLDWQTMIKILNDYNVTEEEKELIHNMLLDLYKKLHKRTTACEVMWNYIKGSYAKDNIEKEIERQLELNPFRP